MFGGSHSHGGGSSGAHTHGSGSSAGCGIAVALACLLTIGLFAGILIVHIISNHAALNQDRVMTPEDKLIRSAHLSISCREIVKDANGTQSVGPRCSSGIRSAALAIQLRGVPHGVKFVNSGARGTYSASCTVIATSDRVAGTSILTRKSQQGTFLSTVWLPSNTCEISILEPSQAVEIDINRWSISDSGTGHYYLISQFTARLDPRWYSNDGQVYSTAGNQ